MNSDPFGNLMDWGPVLDTLDDLAENGKLSKCQPGLIRILRYKGNWRLREQVLRLSGEVQAPSNDLVHQVLSILDDDNIYYDARIIAGNTLNKMLKNMDENSGDDIRDRARKVVRKLKSTPQPPIFDNAIDSLHSELDRPWIKGSPE